MAGRARGDGIDGQAGLVGDDHPVVERFTVGVERIPDREGHPEEPLPGDQPVAVQATHPVVVAVAHVLRGPGQLRAALQQVGLQLFVAATVGQVPLAGGDDLQRLVTLLVEVHGPGDGFRFPVEIPGCAQQLHDGGPGGEDRLAGQVGPGLGVGEPLGDLPLETAVAADDGAGRQIEFPPPLHVGEVTEGAAHRDAGALVGLGGGVRQDRDLHPEDRRRDGGPEQMLVALVIGMGDQGADAGQQLGARGFDEHRPVGAVEGDAVIGARVLPGLQFRLRHRRLERDVPHGWGETQVGLAAGEIAHEGPLGHDLRGRGDRGVEGVPVDGQSEIPPQILEDLLVDGGQFLAQLDEVASRDGHLAFRIRLGRGSEILVVGKRRVAAHTVVVLDAAFGGQTVVVPAHRVEHLLAAHPLVAGDGVGVGVAEDVAHVQRSGDRRWWGVDGEHLLTGCRAPERVGAVLTPYPSPFALETLESGFSGQSGIVGRVSHGRES